MTVKLVFSAGMPVSKRIAGAGEIGIFSRDVSYHIASDGKIDIPFLYALPDHISDSSKL